MKISFELKDETKNFAGIYSYQEQYQEPIEKILNTIKYRGFESSGIAILGEAGVGKSYLAEHFLAVHKRADTREKDGVFGVYVDASTSSKQDFLSNILTKLNDKDPYYGSVGMRKTRVSDLLEQLDVMVVFVDEAHTLLTRQKMDKKSPLVKELKGLINNSNTVWVLLGDDGVLKLLEADDELNDRFGRVHYLKKLSCLGDENITLFLRYLFDIYADFPRGLKYFGFMNDSIVENQPQYNVEANYDNLLRFCLATLGKQRYIRDLMMESIELTDAGQKVTKQILSKAWERRIVNQSHLVDKRDQKQFKEMDNPFEASIRYVKEQLVMRGLYA